MNDQRHKQSWRESNQLTVEGKDGVSAMSSDKKLVTSINNFQQWRTIKECKSSETKRQREKADIHKTKSRE